MIRKINLKMDHTFAFCRYEIVFSSGCEWTGLPETSCKVLENTYGFDFKK